MGRIPSTLPLQHVSSLRLDYWHCYGGAVGAPSVEVLKAGLHGAQAAWSDGSLSCVSISLFSSMFAFLLICIPVSLLSKLSS